MVLELSQTSQKQENLRRFVSSLFHKMTAIQKNINEEYEESTLSEEEFYGSEIDSYDDDNDFLL